MQATLLWTSWETGLDTTKTINSLKIFKWLFLQKKGKDFSFEYYLLLKKYIVQYIKYIFDFCYSLVWNELVKPIKLAYLKMLSLDPIHFLIQKIYQKKYFLSQYKICRRIWTFFMYLAFILENRNSKLI